MNTPSDIKMKVGYSRRFFRISFSPPMYRPVRSVGGVKLKEMPAGVDQSGLINSAQSPIN